MARNSLLRGSGGLVKKVLDFSRFFWEDKYELILKGEKNEAHRPSSA